MQTQRYAFIKANWHAEIVNQALEGFRSEIGGAEVVVYDVPGAFEIPLLARDLAATGRFDAIGGAAFVVDGGIYRHDFVASTVLEGMMRAQMDADVFVRHYTEVADASPVPVLLYNVTMFTGVTLHLEAVERLAAHPNIVGMKESGSDIGYISELVSRTPDDFTVLAGSATTFFHALCAGCDGAILALAALLPEACVRMQALVMEQRLAEARALQHRIMPLARSVTSAMTRIRASTIKAMPATLMGMIVAM